MIITMTIGSANAPGRFITRLTSTPQKPFSTSARVLVFCVFSASQFSHQTIGPRMSGTARAMASPAMTTATKITMPSRIQYSAPSTMPASRRAITPYPSAHIRLM